MCLRQILNFWVASVKLQKLVTSSRLSKPSVIHFQKQTSINRIIQGDKWLLQTVNWGRAKTFTMQWSVMDHTCIQCDWKSNYKFINLCKYCNIWGNLWSTGKPGWKSFVEFLSCCMAECAWSKCPTLYLLNYWKAVSSLLNQFTLCTVKRTGHSQYTFTPIF